MKMDPNPNHPPAADKENVVIFTSRKGKSPKKTEGEKAGGKGKKRVSFGGAGGGSAPQPRLSPGGFGLSKQQQPKCTTTNAVPTAFINASNEASQVLLNGKSYTRVGVLGKGGSSCVYRVLAPDGQLFAYKRVEIRGGDDGESLCESYINEIQLLQNLKGSPHIIELLDAEVDREQVILTTILTQSIHP